MLLYLYLGGFRRSNKNSLVEFGVFIVDGPDGLMASGFDPGFP